MSSNWQDFKLTHHIKIKHGFAFKGEYITTMENNNILLTPGNFNISGGFKGDKFKYFESEDFPKEYILRPDDLIVTMTDLSKQGDTLGYSAKVPNYQNKKILHNQRIGLVQFLNDELDKDYLYWVMRSNKYQSYIVNTATGTTVKHTSPNRITEYSFKAPIDLKTQKKIAHILSTLDDKIELNRKMNQTLESMASAIFKSWFVDFDPVHVKVNAAGREDALGYKANCESEAELENMAQELGISKAILDLFPNEFEESELGMIPKGWTIINFKDLVEKYIDNRGKTPPLVENGIPLLEVRTLLNEMLSSEYLTDKCVSDEVYDTWFRSHLETDDILISTVGTIGLTSVVPPNSKFVIAQNVLGIRANEEFILKKFMFYLMKSKSFMDAINARLVTTVQSSIKRKDMETINILVPNFDIQKEFVKVVTPIMEKMQSNEILTLQKTRDTLLPKLLSGEIDVSELKHE